MTKKQSTAPLFKKLMSWRNYDGTGDEYRKTHDLDCILTGGDLNADTIFSLWLPLRYTLNYFNKPQWKRWKEIESTELKPNRLGLKDCPAFLDDMMAHIDQFLDVDSEITQKLLLLFELGQERCNVMLLPKRSWNSLRGSPPYWDYFPHFLLDLFAYSADEAALRRWLKEQSLDPFFANEIFSPENILDLAETGSIRQHTPQTINLGKLLEHYIVILLRRAELLSLRTA